MTFLTQVNVHCLDQVVWTSADNHAQCTHKHCRLYFNMSLKPILRRKPTPQHSRAPMCVSRVKHVHVVFQPSVSERQRVIEA